MGESAARGLTPTDGHAGPADRTAGHGGKSRSAARQNGALTANPTRSGSDHGTGLRADHGRREPLPARQTGGQLSGSDSARAFLGRTSETGRDHQAGQSHAAHVTGGGSTNDRSFRSRISQGVFASLPSEAERRGQGGGGAQVGSTTVLDAAHTKAVSGGRS